LTILKLCSNCGLPSGEWATDAERDAELNEFAGRVQAQS
jgi:hypothetical protein